MILSHSSLNLAIQTNTKIWSDIFHSTRNTIISQVYVYGVDGRGQLIDSLVFLSWLIPQGVERFNNNLIA